MYFTDPVEKRPGQFKGNTRFYCDIVYLFCPKVEAKCAWKSKLRAINSSTIECYIEKRPPPISAGLHTR